MEIIVISNLDYVDCVSSCQFYVVRLFTCKLGSQHCNRFLPNIDRDLNSTCVVYRSPFVTLVTLAKFV